MMRPLILFLYLLLLTSTSYARLGETENQLIERFGAPVLRAKHQIIAQGKMIDLGPRLLFREGDWRIACDLIDGKCARITYTKPGDWTEDQVQLVLSNNAQGAKWSETSKPGAAKMLRDWKRSDGSVARWSRPEGFTVTWDFYLKAKARAEERARVEASRKPKI